jgi:ribosomal protein L40E
MKPKHLQSVQFPDLCARCGAAPPTTTSSVRSDDWYDDPEGSKESVTLHIDVPICAKCNAQLAGSFWWTFLCATPFGGLGGLWMFNTWAPPRADYWLAVAVCVGAGFFTPLILGLVLRAIFFRSHCNFARLEGENLVFTHPEYNRLYQEMNPPPASAALAPPWSRVH